MTKRYYIRTADVATYVGDEGKPELFDTKAEAQARADEVAESTPSKYGRLMVSICPPELLPKSTPEQVQCGGCGDPAGIGDRLTDEYPFCRDCHYNGTAWAVRYGMEIAQLESYGLRAQWWHTGGGCFVLVIQRADAPDQWAEISDESGEWVEGGPWEPFVGVTLEGNNEHFTDAEWSAYAWLTSDAWNGGDDFDGAPTIETNDMTQVAALALKHLPATAVKA